MHTDIMNLSRKVPQFTFSCYFLNSSYRGFFFTKVKNWLCPLDFPNSNDTFKLLKLKIFIAWYAAIMTLLKLKTTGRGTFFARRPKNASGQGSSTWEELKKAVTFSFIDSALKTKQ